VNGKVAASDMAGALNASRKAKMFSYIAIGLGLALWVCYFIFGAGLVGLSILSNA
jgi:hypothetical protein